MNNHYVTLGLQPNADKAEIKSAYEKLSLKFHPDNNKGDEYFEKMFQDIQVAYDTLSNDQTKAEHDLAHNKTAKVSGKPDLNNQSLKIDYFESDKDSFEEGENIRLSWKTSNADKVVIKPFGTVDKSGTKIFKLKNFNKETLPLTLQASSSIPGEILTKTLKLKNNITEFDFATLEDDEEVETDILQQEDENTEVVKEEPPIHSNSFTEPLVSEEKITDERFEDNVEESFFSSKGRLRRSTYFWRSLLLGIPGFLIYTFSETGYDEGILTFAPLLMLGIVFSVWIQTIKRLHDLDQSGWLSLLQLIPIVNFIFGLYLLFSDSKRGSNEYGPDPKRR